MADSEVVTKQLKIAGYDGIEFERIDAPLLVGHDPDEAVEFQLAIGPAGEIFREAGEMAEQRRDEIVDALKQELARHETSEGVVLGSSSWMVTARNPR